MKRSLRKYMRTLILSCNTGEGHNSCAKAIKEIYDLNHADCAITDGLAFVSERASDFISWGHTFMYRRLPSLFRWGYSSVEKHPDTLSEDSKVYNLFSKGVERLRNHIMNHGYDTVICTHVFPALMITELQRRHGTALKTAFVATDYTCSPGVKDSVMDVYFIPDAGLADDFLCENIPKDKIVASGIPIRQMFYRKTENSKEALGLPADCKHMVMMCGSMGCGPIEDIAEALAERMTEKQILTVICGTNENLRQKMEKKFRDCNTIRIEGFVKDMSVMLDSADLYLTKPGGISVTETAVKQIPMVLIDAVAGCEAYNLNWFIGAGCAVTEKEITALADTSVTLLSNPVWLQDMKTAYDAMTFENAAQMIYNTMCRAVIKK